MIVNNPRQNKTVQVKLVYTSDVITELSHGMLYHLKYTYPVIDAVGYLDVDNVASLVFVQVSLSPYSSHSTKMSDLTTTTAPEVRDKTILN